MMMTSAIKMLLKNEFLTFQTLLCLFAPAEFVKCW